MKPKLFNTYDLVILLVQSSILSKPVKPVLCNTPISYNSLLHISIIFQKVCFMLTDLATTVWNAVTTIKAFESYRTSSKEVWGMDGTFSVWPKEMIYLLFGIPCHTDYA